MLIHVRTYCPFEEPTYANTFSAKQSEAREITDWSRKGPLPDLPGRGGNDRGADRGYNSGGRFDSAEGGRERREFNQDDGKVRDFGNWERKGPLASLPQAPTREGGRTNTVGPRGDSFNDRRASPAAWGEGRPQGSQDGGSRPPRHEFQERPSVDRAPTAAEQDNKWRNKMRPDAPSANPSHDGSEAPGSPAAAPAGRPKLNLTKRTVSEAVDAPATSGDAKASPFGAARPIDTAAKEREIEEKRIAALKEKKEADDKAREEKKAKEAEAAAVADVTQETEGLEIADGEAKKEAKPVEAPKPSESAWRKPAAAAAPKAAQADVPRAPRRDGPPRGGRTDNRAPRNDNRAPRANGGEKAAAPTTPAAAPATPAVEAEAAAAAPEDDGWSTVQKPKKTQRGGRN